MKKRNFGSTGWYDNDGVATRGFFTRGLDNLDRVDMDEKGLPLDKNIEVNGAAPIPNPHLLKYAEAAKFGSTNTGPMFVKNDDGNGNVVYFIYYMTRAVLDFADLGIFK